MPDQYMIPALPCRSINETLEFYVALGFEITYQQERPNNYAVVKRGGIEMHFFSMRDYEPSASYSTCLVVVPDVEALRKAFVEGARSHYGRMPAAGIPRITPLRNKADGGKGFNVIDPGGNWIRIFQTAAAITSSDTPEKPAVLTKLSRAIHAANLLAESKGDYAAAAKMLDGALAQAENEPLIHRVQALVARAEVAVTMGEPQIARNMLSQVQAFDLSAEDRAALADEFQRIADLDGVV
ncbi:MAG: VOC family protein [Burkholderiales bacterium]|nr:VOC family protein [Anaerolineae bacterium]